VLWRGFIYTEPGRQLAAGIGRACGPGASPATPDLRESAQYVLFLAAVYYYSFFFYFVVALLSELVGLASVVCVPVSTVHRSSR
jgi:hypothetical protein